MPLAGEVESMRWRWKYLGLVVAVLLGLIVVPVAVRQLRPVAHRSLQGVSLVETRYRDVRFHNSKHGLDLTGMLFVPEGDGPFPAAVIIHGSGTSKRDNSWYLTLASYLQRNGVVVLLPDKRGSEQSSGNWRTASFDDLAGDTVAAIDFLKTRSDMQISRIGIVGMSQGGHIAPLVADRSPDVEFVVNVVGSVVPMRDALLYEENHNLRQLGLLPGISNAVAYLSTAYLVNVSQKEFWTAIDGYDPLPYWRTLEVPALAVYGRDDTNVDALTNANLLRSLGKPNIEVLIYDGSGHAVEAPPTKGNRIFRDDALQRIRDFIQNRA
jgi:dienelactone hydrolase